MSALTLSIAPASALRMLDIANARGAAHVFAQADHGTSEAMVAGAVLNWDVDMECPSLVVRLNPDGTWTAEITPTFGEPG